VKRVFLCVPKEDENFYLTIVQNLALEAMQRHFAPFAPSLYLQVVIGNAEKAMAMQSALAFLQVCDEIWVYGDPSLSMQTEISMALELGIPVKQQALSGAMN
jgi:hypothetical protein